MRVLAEQTQETIHLSLLDRADVIYLHKIESPQPVRAYSSIGGRAPAYCVASGKALLAYQEEALAHLPETLPLHTPRTIPTLDLLRRSWSRSGSRALRSIAGSGAKASAGSPPSFTMPWAVPWPRSASPVRPTA